MVQYAAADRPNSPTSCVRASTACGPTHHITRLAVHVCVAPAASVQLTFLS